MVKNIDVLSTLKKSFQICFKNPLLLAIFILPLLLSIIMFLIALLLLVYSIYPMNFPTILLSLVILIFSLWFAMVGAGGIILSVERIVSRRHVKFLEVLDQSLRNSVRLSIAYSLEQLFLVLGLLLFIIPGIFLAVRLSLVTPGCILEKKGYGIKRSWYATKGNFWKIFLVLVIWNAGFIAIGFLPYISFINIFLLPVYLTTLTLLYIQLRKR